MIDREARDKLTELLSRFRNGEIAGSSLLSSWPGSQDEAISGIGRDYGIILGASHISRNWKRVELKVTEMRDREFMIRRVDRTVLFLQTDLEYLWRGDPLLGDPTLLPFQALAFLIALPLMSLGLLYVEDMAPSADTLLAVFLVLALAAATLIGGVGLRSLFTGIDRRVWPFYRRRQYQNARTHL